MLNLAELSASTEERPSAGMQPSAMPMGRPVGQIREDYLYNIATYTFALCVI